MNRRQRRARRRLFRQHAIEAYEDNPNSSLEELAETVKRRVADDLGEDPSEFDPATILAIFEMIKMIMALFNR